jgi:cell division protein FtsQ
MGDRLAEKRAMSRHRIAKRIAITVALAAALAGLIWGAYFSPALMLDPAHVSVTGQGDTVNAAQVTAILSEQAGVPLPRVDTGDLRQQVEALNGVKEARIVRAWPRGLTAHLLARQPAAAVPAAGGYAIIDAEGVRVAVAPEPGEGLPIIVLPLIDGEPEAQAPAVQQPAALTAALTVLHALPEDLAADVRQVEVSTRDDVRTVLHSGQVIRWGDSTRLPVKLAVVRTLRDADPHSREFDVSAPEIPVTR